MNDQCWSGYTMTGIYSAGVNRNKLGQLWKTIWCYLLKLKMCANDLGIPLLKIQSWETCTWAKGMSKNVNSIIFDNIINPQTGNNPNTFYMKVRISALWYIFRKLNIEHWKWMKYRCTYWPGKYIKKRECWINKATCKKPSEIEFDNVLCL